MATSASESALADDTCKLMKLYILCDLEGAAGVVSFEQQVYADAPGLEDARRLSTLELNALVDGCVDGGADQIVVLDGHGVGGLTFELLHERAELIMGRPLRPPFELDASFDALLLHDHHTMNHAPTGVLCHSWSSQTVDECRLNDEPIGEIGVNAATAGYFGVPTIFVSGDRDTVAEARQYVPNIESAETKVGLSRTSAISVSTSEACRRHRESGRRAVERLSHGQFKPFVIDGPFEFVTRYSSKQIADSRGPDSSLQRVDERTVRVTGDDLIDVLQRR
ncbi:MAG: aminopeptidase [Planctomycetaceae bacterium]|nr:aminopeptidase [Planctomycetaceae bacterium]